MIDYRLNDNGWRDVTDILFFDKVVKNPDNDFNISDNCMWVYPENPKEVHKKIKKLLNWYEGKKIVEIGKPYTRESDKKTVIKIIRK